MTDRRERAQWLARNVVPHEIALRSWLFRHRSPTVDVDDIVQEAYAILAGLDTVAHIRNPRSYLFQTARSVLLRQLRREKVVRFQTLSEDDQADTPAVGGSPEEMAILRDELRRADALLASMPDRVREAFVLRRVEGLSQKQIAQAMQVSENTVEKHIGKALRVIMQAIANGNGGRQDPGVSNSPTRLDAASASRAGQPRERRGRLADERN